jgi:hypothetical protein
MSTPVEQSAEEPKLSLAKFLESVPPGSKEATVGKLLQIEGGHVMVARPDLHLYCEKCDGLRSFQASGDFVYVSDTPKNGYLIYLCRNCRNYQKTYAVAVKRKPQELSGWIFKYAEVPAYGPPTPARVISLIGPDRDHYLQGRRSENQGFGIGAFAYYRRVLENQKGRIIREMAKVAKKVGASSEVLAEFEAAAAETQFSTAIERMKHGIPSALLINTHNPLSLLHTALSQGLHEENDDTCLELAASIRLILTDLAERMSQVLKDEAELSGAVTKLLNRKTAPKAP